MGACIAEIYINIKKHFDIIEHAKMLLLKKL